MVQTCDGLEEMDGDLAAAVTEARETGGEEVALAVIREYIRTDGWRLCQGAGNVVEVAFR